MAQRRKPGFYWVGRGKTGVAEIGRWTGDGWWLTGHGTMLPEEEIEVLSARLRCRALPESPAGLWASCLFASALAALAIVIRIDPGQNHASLGGALIFLAAISGLVALDSLLRGSAA